MINSFKYAINNSRFALPKFIPAIILLLLSAILILNLETIYKIIIFISCFLLTIIFVGIRKLKVIQLIKRNPIILIWLLFFIGFLSVGSVISPENLRENPITTREIRVATILISGLISFIILTHKKILPKMFKGLLGLVILYFFAALISTINSPYIALTIFKSIEILACVMALGTAYASKDVLNKPGLLINTTVFFIFIVILMIWTGLIISPESAIINIRGKSPFLNIMLRGVWPPINPNKVGYLGGILGIFSFVYFIREKANKRKIKYFVLFSMGTLTTIFSYSRAALVAFPITIFFSFIMCKKYVKGLILLTAIISILILPSINYSLQEYFKRGQKADNVLDIAEGRLNTWKDAFEISKKNILIGYGYSAGFRYASWTKWGHAHSAPFEILYGMGIFGVIIWYIILLKLFTFLVNYLIKNRSKMNSEHISIHISGISLLTYSFLRSLAGSFMVYFNYSFMILVSIILYSELLRKRSIK